jgi:hypothetical protein
LPFGSTSARKAQDREDNEPVRLYPIREIQNPGLLSFLSLFSFFSFFPSSLFSFCHAQRRRRTDPKKCRVSGIFLGRFVGGAARRKRKKRRRKEREEGKKREETK